MTASELLELLEKNRIKVWAEGGRLHYHAPQGALTAKLKNMLAGHKDEVLSLLTGSGGSGTVPGPPQEDFVSPLSHSQRFMWFLHQLAPESPAYNVAFVGRLVSPVDRGRFDAAFQALVDRHEMLRTIYDAADGVPFMRTLPRLELVCEHIDASGWTEEALEEEVRGHYSRPFDLKNGPILRVALFSAGPEDHVLLLNVHHIACDAQALAILVREFRDLYASGPETAELPELGAPYTDFIRFQEGTIGSREAEERLAFWKEQLSGDLPELQLPIDKPRPPVRSQQGATHHFTLNGDLYKELTTLARDSGVTLYTCLLASLQTLLMRYSGQNDILIGTPVAGRPREEDASSVGSYINPIVIRGDIQPGLTFRELLGKTSLTVAGALKNRDYPFPLVVEKISPARDPGRLPIFEVMFNMLNRRTLGDVANVMYRDRKTAAAARASGFGALRIKPFPLDQEEGQFDLFFEMVDNGRSLTALIKYSTDLFEKETIVRLAGHYENLLRGIVADPDSRLDGVPLLKEAERLTILRDWNGPRVDRPRDLRLHDMFEEQVRKTPDAPAVVFEESTLTYRELDLKAEDLAERLRGLGVAPGVPVGIHFERSLEMVTAIYAVLKAGGAYMPLDPDFPAERLALMIEESRTPVIITSPKGADRLPPNMARTVLFDLSADAGRDEEVPRTREAVRKAGPDDMAYVIYTSGSTGIPKGVVNTHRGICNRILWMQEAFGLKADDTVLQKTPYSFDVSVWEFFWPLAVGARLVIARPEGHRDTAYLAGTIARHKVTTVHFVPSMLQLFLEDGEAAASCRSLRRVICSGEALSFELQERFFSLLNAELHNLYGPTEAAVDVTWWKCRKGDARRIVPIGRPISNTQIYILNRAGRPVPPGVPGEIHIGGVQVAAGYLNRPELTAERFVPDPFSGTPDAKMYRTGDLGRHLADGSIEFLGRADNQVKIRGMRIEPDEIEAAIRKFPGVSEALVTAREFSPGDKRLVGYVKTAPGTGLSFDELRAFLRSRLAEYMVPSAFVRLDEFPLTPSGKVDRRALPAPEGTRQTRGAFAAPQSEAERRITGIWQDLLRIDEVGRDDNFFDLGGHSLLIVRMTARLKEAFHKDLSVVDLFQHPTVRQQAELLAGVEKDERPGRTRAAAAAVVPGRGEKEGIAVIGMACRFPGAPTVEKFWENLRNGVESILRLTDKELDALGVPPEIYGSPNYVKASSTIEGGGLFDAGFFGYAPREAEKLDPQHRLFLECGWLALENAGCDPSSYGGSIGVFAGSGPNYYGGNRSDGEDCRDVVETYRRELGNEKDYLSTRLSYKLDLRGPSLTVQTACSTSLAAAHLAVQNLLTGQCDVALAGGVSFNARNKGGYFYQEGMIPSPDGHCRAFDAGAKGTVVGQGVGIVVLKRLSDALADGDTIHAVIRASAMNNDGAARVGFTAPGLDGQSAVITAALDKAGVSPEDIGYIEAHGTGTPLGDPIEIKALTRVYRRHTDKKGFCAIGSVKTNIGHLDAAAGVAGLIKTVLILEHGEIPPSLHFETPNPELELESSPFFVSTKLGAWPDGGSSRLAGLSSFGLGGTNVHMIIESPPEAGSSTPARPKHLLVLSAKTAGALDGATAALAGHLAAHPDIDIADTAYTLQTGRKAFDHRRTVVCGDAAGAVKALTSGQAGGTASAVIEKGRREVAFMFSGQGSQYAGMGRGLYEEEKVFREAFDRCSELLAGELPDDLRRLVFPEAESTEESEERLKQTSLAQPALFAMEYALAELWMSWGIRPQAMIGHSIGEYTAACLAGVFPLADALKLVAARGRLMQTMPPGAMLSVPLSPGDLKPWLNEELDLAVINGPALCVVSGTEEAVGKLGAVLDEKGIASRRVRTSHAFHSRMMGPILAPFRVLVEKAGPRAPKIPFISNVSGTWITPEEAADPGYWTTHLRRTVDFSGGIGTLLEEPGRVLLEVGPGRALATMASGRPDRKKGHLVISSSRHVQEQQPDGTVLLETLAALWRSGVSVDWEAYHQGTKRRKLPLPGYAFERELYWIDSPCPRTAGGEKRTGKVRGHDATSAASRRVPSQAATAGGMVKSGSLRSAPGTRTEEVLTGLWQEVLGAKDIGPDDDFFELGGHSLVAVTLLTNIEKVFGTRFPLASLIGAPTIRRFAELLKDKADGPGWSPLVALNSSGSKPPFFLMHSHGGNILEYQPLAHELGKDRPIYALQAKGLDGSPIVESRLEDMAEAYLREIRSVQPHGPYRLGGFCFGGFLALEAAHQLEAGNERVSLLVMINSGTNDYPRYSGPARHFRRLFAAEYRAALELSGLRGKSFREALTHIAGRGRRVREVLQARMERSRGSSSDGGRKEHSLVYHLERLAEANDRAWAAYKPSAYDGRVLFFSAENQPPGIIPDDMLGWTGLLTGHVDTLKIPGFRQTMLDEPNVRQLAAVLKTELDHLDNLGNKE